MPSSTAIYNALYFIGPRIPLLLYTTLTHALNIHENAQYWDLKLALIVTFLRSLTNTSPTDLTMTGMQRFSKRDPGVKGNTWVSRVEFPKPKEEDVLEKLLGAVDDLKKGYAENGEYDRPPLLPVEAEWTGNRTDAEPNAPEPKVSEGEKYARMMNEITGVLSQQPGTEDCTTVLYMHGGALYLMDPASHRPNCRNLAKLTRGRVLSVRYRLAPQHAFPAPLLDCFIAYLSLLYPPPGSLHKPVKPEKIVFAGDSAGGMLAFSLLLLLLHLRRTKNATVRFNGENVSLPLPAGVATMSPWLDVTQAMPSLETNARFDYLPIPPVDLPSARIFNYKPCQIWPSSPPRCDFSCTGIMMCHPLVSPLAAPVEMWKDGCPLFFTVGQEMLTDESIVVARRNLEAGNKVRWEGFEGMPHCFGAMVPGSPASQRVFASWGSWIADITQNLPTKRPGAYPMEGGISVEAKTLKEKQVDLKTLVPVGDKECAILMQKAKERRIKIFNDFVRLKAKEIEQSQRAKL